ncbi:MAG: type II toxin-antitoxin system VapC family toxin [Rhodobacteraceae bacterium]|nr:type II toxin-antitoxin system VapC family toxin [Paracoccaceae bacterium]
MSNLLLDTCAMLWIGHSEPLTPGAMEALEVSRLAGRKVQCSPYSAWELGMLVAHNRLHLTQSPAHWFRRFLDQDGLGLAELTQDTLVDSSFLPATPPGDPADRIIIATARAQGLTILTRDRQILDYAKQGHVMALEC